MSFFTLLDQADDGMDISPTFQRISSSLNFVDKLHTSRLLTVDENPFKRLTKRLLAPIPPIQSFYTRLPTPLADQEADRENIVGDAAPKRRRKI
jgi:hypothetical protein